MSTERQVRAVILGAGRSIRGTLPSAAMEVGDGGRVLDWILDALAALDGPQITFVAGFRAEEVLERFPDVRIVLNRQWSRTGPLGSLMLAPLDASTTTFVCYSDVVFRPQAVAAVRDAAGDVVLAVDSTWRSRYSNRERRAVDLAEKVTSDGTRVSAIGPWIEERDASAEFAGLLRIGPLAAALCLDGIDRGDLGTRSTLPELVTYCLNAGLHVTSVDLEGQWAELDAKQDLAHFVLGTKAESLERLRPLVRQGAISPLVRFSKKEWDDDPERWIDAISAQLPRTELIVRSSARSEDGWLQSGAGRHLSVLNIAGDRHSVVAAIESVFESYGLAEPHDQVLVQAMLKDVAVSGVVMTRTPTENAPYYVIDFDDTTRRTDTVTAGHPARTILMHRDAVDPVTLAPMLRPVLTAIREIESLVGHDSLDIEFAIATDGTVHILQVRPIASARQQVEVDDTSVAQFIQRAGQHLVTRQLPPPGIVGSHVRYSVMSDWNPAEIIGTRPKPLATSLYRYLITDGVWAQQRAEYGYRDVRPRPLLVDFAGHPYVDVRASFNSFVPAALDEDFAGRLVDHYLATLAAEPLLHDKVEFDVVLTCMTADWNVRAEGLAAAGFTSPEMHTLATALIDITSRGIARVGTDLRAAEECRAATDTIIERVGNPIEQGYYLLETVRSIGTPAFAHLARAGFVATAILRSLVAVGALDHDEHLQLLSSINTVLTELQSDAWLVAVGDLRWDSFVARYGHLRPGTYDLTSDCYAAEPELYLRPLVEQARPPADRAPFIWSQQAQREVPKALAGVGLPVPISEFEQFVRTAIAGREYGKFVFTRGLSVALEHFVSHAANHGVTREDLSFVPVNDILRLLNVVPDPAAILLHRAAEGREAHGLTQAICLPAQIATPDDLYCFEQGRAEANFVTSCAVVAPVMEVPDPSADVRGHIILIPTADPGYDWLLARDIAGLITMYGGANSHMAVRSAELGLPAAIGVGEVRYRILASAASVRLDCASKTMTVVR